MAVIEQLDFLGVPPQHPERDRAFHRRVLGLRPGEHAEWEQWARPYGGVVRPGR